MYRSSVIADHERQIITGAVEMIPDIFPFITNANMFNMHFVMRIHRYLRWSGKRARIGFSGIHTDTALLPTYSFRPPQIPG